MGSFEIGQLVGVLFGVALIWLGSKGFSERGIPISKGGGLKGTKGKIVGIIFLLWGCGIVAQFVIGLLRSP